MANLSRAILTLALLLVGCGGSDFHSLFGPEGDASGDAFGGSMPVEGAGGKRAHELAGSGGAVEADAGDSAGGSAAGSGGSSAGGAAPLEIGGTGGAVGTGGATAPDCSATQKKLCGGKCISAAEATPSVGCWEASCTPCAPPPAHAHALCTNGQCDFECEEGYQRSASGCVAACGEVVHDNGLGQTWSDCTPRGTFTQDQAVKACEAWCAVNGACHCAIGTFCGDSSPRVYAPRQSSFLTWVWQGDAGNVVQADPGSAGQPACTVVSNWQ